MFSFFSNMSLTVLYLCLSLFYLSGYAYNTVDVFRLSCGNLNNSTDIGNRTWTGDIHSDFLLPIESQQEKESVIAASTVRQPSAYDVVPYITARLSRYNFSSSFPVTAGQKFIRLYFYPTSYGPDFDRSQALFSVKSGTFTLLEDFNASLTADADNDHHNSIFREYIINVDEGQRLNLTFSPSTIQRDSYAFINGIEILSMPTNLYYTNSQNPAGLKSVGSTPFYNITNNTALETVYRINAGGGDISTSRDTGLLRYWEGDSNYKEAPGAMDKMDDFNVTELNFTQVANYTAPDPVYRTARSMGENATFNKISNLTWEFSVGSGFTYMLRLHFCEFSQNISKPGDRVFDIYIADQLAEEAADILKWSKEKRVPVYKDYAVSVPGNQKKSNLSIRMHPSPTSIHYSGAILNGLEIFKISNDSKLAGPNPDLPPMYQQPVLNSKERRTKIIIATVAGVVSCVTLLYLLVYFVIKQGKKLKDTKSGEGSSSIPSYTCRHFSIDEIRVATENFNEQFIIGKGGFGDVYKGYIDDATTPVAIKRLKQGSQQGAQEFMTEIEMLSQLVHRNLVSLIGYCNDENEMILVYEFVNRGTLRDHLYNTHNQVLPWKLRLQICIGAAHGLYYLHAGAKHNIIHRDVKSTNILLNEKWVAKVSDFGLSKVGPTGVSKSHITTAVKGTFGYLDPEYYMRQRLTLMSDVYAFGVVLLEVLCGRPPLLRSVKQQACLVDWVQKYQSEGKIDQTVDPSLKETIAPESLKTFTDLAMDCLLDNGNQRPPMNEVLWGLKFALKLQESAERAISSFRKTKGEEKDLNKVI
ncbi:hypothetical protein L6164_002115 [Bauhinia variegata]|uniref:Uncharacterized protein n=1 Tax=Bauhinia variegata TaxID=167791 RepID=A0ACB9PXQ7_BAUVA|nr:hypothetical protein L6164_002115 [Bauhinia variegata]